MLPGPEGSWDEVEETGDSVLDTIPPILENGWK